MRLGCHAPEFSLADLIGLLNDPAAQMAMVTHANPDEDQMDAAPEFRVLDVVNLPNVTGALSAADAAALSAAASNNAAQIQAFLTSDSGTAVVLRRLLTDAGIDPAGVVALVTNDEQRLVVLTSA